LSSKLSGFPADAQDLYEELGGVLGDEDIVVSALALRGVAIETVLN